MQNLEWASTSGAAAWGDHHGLIEPTAAFDSFPGNYAGQQIAFGSLSRSCNQNVMRNNIFFTMIQVKVHSWGQQVSVI
jgi:hypothetical protein